MTLNPLYIKDLSSGFDRSFFLYNRRHRPLTTTFRRCIAPCGTWQVYGHTAIPLLEQMLPWLIVKRARVEMALGLVEFTEDLRYVRK